MNTCVICGKDKARKVSSTRTVHLLGRTESFERRNFECGACGETYTDDEQGSANERAERVATCRALRQIGGAEMKELRDLVHVTQTELENALGLGRNTVARWETGARPLPPYIKSMIRLLALNPTALMVLKEQVLPESEQVDAVSSGIIQPVAAVRYRQRLPSRRDRVMTLPPPAVQATDADAWSIISARVPEPARRIAS